MITDVNVFVGGYPWRRVPGTSPDAVCAALDRAGTTDAWVSHLPSVFWTDPASGNAWLYEVCARAPRLHPVPAVQPGVAHWEESVAEAVARGAPVVRCDPMFHGLDPTGPAMRRLLAVAAETGIGVAMAVRLEDLRQRHPNDRAGDLPPSAVRTLIRSHPRARLLITHADRGFIEEVHFGSTPAERDRIWWDVSWVWGPPEDHLALLLRTIGPERFVFGSGTPLRLAETPRARLDLTPVDAEARALIEHGNADILARRTAA